MKFKLSSYRHVGNLKSSVDCSRLWRKALARDNDCAVTAVFSRTHSQTGLKPEGVVVVAGNDRAQQLLACHAAVSNAWYLEGRFRESIAWASPHTEKPPAWAGGFFSCSRVAAYLLTWRLAPPLAGLAWVPRTSPLETSLTQSEPLPL